MLDSGLCRNDGFGCFSDFFNKLLVKSAEYFMVRLSRVIGKHAYYNCSWTAHGILIFGPGMAGHPR